MKIKFSRIMAIGCALSVAFAGLTAFADVTVTTTTTYDHEPAEGVTTMRVDTEVTGLTNGTEVTYYVSKDADNTDIVYINQDTAADNKVSFSFTANTADVLLANARYGSDAGLSTFPTFYFNEGSNFFESTVGETPNAVDATEDDTVWGATSYGDETETGYYYKAKLEGNATEYGIEADGVRYPAAGCAEDGTYIVVLQGFETKPTTVTAYAEYTVPTVISAE